MTSLTKTLGIVLAAACWLGPTAEGGTISVQWDPTIDQLVLTADGPYTRVQVEGAAASRRAAAWQSEPAEPPGLAGHPARGDRHQPQHDRHRREGRQAVTVYPAQPDRTPDEPPLAFVEPDASTFNMDAMFPAESGMFLGTSRVGGYQLAICG